MLCLYFFLLGSCAENAGPNANNIAPSHERSLEIARHAHAQQQPAFPVAPLPRLPREARARKGAFEDVPRRDEAREVLVLLLLGQRLRERPDRHQALQPEAGTLCEDVLGHLHELGAVDLGLGRACGQRGHAGLLVLAGGVDLEEDVQRGGPVLWERLVQRRGGFGGGEGLDGVEVRDGYAAVSQRSARDRTLGATEHVQANILALLD